MACSDNFSLRLAVRRNLKNVNAPIVAPRIPVTAPRKSGFRLAAKIIVPARAPARVRNSSKPG
jgi:hypothetical protein